MDHENTEPEPQNPEPETQSPEHGTRNTEHETRNPPGTHVLLLCLSLFGFTVFGERVLWSGKVDRFVPDTQYVNLSKVGEPARGMAGLLA